jgi:hypothetical protein
MNPLGLFIPANKLRVRIVILVGALLFADSAFSQGLVAYYQIGGNAVPWVKWDTYVVDSDSVVEDGQFIRYKSFRITSAGSDPAQELRANCKTLQRGLAADSSMYSTYDGTLTGQEVKAACAIAVKKGILNS